MSRYQHREPAVFEARVVKLPSERRVLSLAFKGRGRPVQDLLAESLKTNFKGEKPDALLIELGDASYRLTSHDLGRLIVALKDGMGNDARPCAIVATGECGQRIKKTLEITQLTRIMGLRLVETSKEGMAHIETHLPN